jgi:hypothetical protein
MVGGSGCWWTDSGTFDLSQIEDLAPATYECPSSASCSATTNQLQCSLNVAGLRSYYCAPDGGLANKATLAWLADCGSYVALGLGFADTGEVDYYDAATGALIAVIFHDYTSKDSCRAGPPMFVAPSCATSRSLCN